MQGHAVVSPSCLYTFKKLFIMKHTIRLQVESGGIHIHKICTPVWILSAGVTVRKTVLKSVRRGPCKSSPGSRML